MPTQVLPITDLAKSGVIEDTPAVSLPPNVFSDVRNVRFHDGTIRKMEGEEVVYNFPGANVIYVAWWPNPNLAPNSGYYVVVTEAGGVESVNLIVATATTASAGNRWDLVGTNPIAGGQWQHTLFAGGFGFVLNNGLETPRYILDQEGSAIDNLFFAPLPNWDSYFAQENVTSIIWDMETPTISLGRSISLDLVTLDGSVDTIPGTQRLLYRVIPRDPSLPVLTTTVSQLERADNLRPNYNTAVGSLFRVRDSEADVWQIEPTLRDTTTTPTNPQLGAEEGDTIEIAVQERPEIIVTAGIIRGYGNLLVAGNLRETDLDGNVLRHMPGVIRTSDVAAPGNIPLNWNPFRNGANSADEFTLSSTGIVQEMAELQGNLFVYTNNSIHSIQATGGNIPFSVRPVTDSYGAQTAEAVLEFDGKHFVVGSNDIYLFGGHPGSIQSIADGRVRQFFFRDLAPETQSDMFILRNQRFDEIWICYRSNDARVDATGNDRALIWNYRENTWTIREQSYVTSGDMAPHHTFRTTPDGTVVSLNPSLILPIFGSNSDVIEADEPGVFTDVGGSYTSYIERKRFAMTPEFTTENLLSVAMLTEDGGTLGLTGNTRVDLFIRVTGTDVPAQDTDLSTTGNTNATFATDTDYKVDIREHGRLLNYRITDDGFNQDTGDRYWSIVGLQFDIGTGGTR